MSNLLSGCPVYCRFCIFIKMLNIVLGCAICCSMEKQCGFFSYNLFISVTCLCSAFVLQPSSSILVHLCNHSHSKPIGTSVSWMPLLCTVQWYYHNLFHGSSVTGSYLHLQVVLVSSWGLNELLKIQRL